MTSLVIGTSTISGSTQTAVFVGERVGFSALDTPSVSPAATPGQVYAAPFTLAAGSHSLAYYSLDNAGNVERVNISTLSVTLPPAAVQGGRGLATAPDGTLWSAGFTSNGVAFEHFDAAGTFLSSAALPGACVFRT